MLTKTNSKSVQILGRKWEHSAIISARGTIKIQIGINLSMRLSNSRYDQVLKMYLNRINKQNALRQSTQQLVH